MTDSEINKEIEELKKGIESLSKAMAKHGWSEIDGDSCWLDEQDLETAKIVLHDRKLLERLRGYSEFTKELIQVLDENKIKYTFKKDKCCSESEIIKISYNYECCLIEECESSVDVEKEFDNNILVFEEAELGSGETEDVMKNFKTELIFALESNNVKYTIEKDDCCPEIENITMSHNNIIVKAKVYTNKKKVVIELIKGDKSDKEKFLEAKKDLAQNIKKVYKVKLKGDDYKRYFGTNFNEITLERKVGLAEVYVKNNKVIFDGKKYAASAKTIDFIVDNVGGKTTKYLRSNKIREYKKPKRDESRNGNILDEQKKLYEKYKWGYRSCFTCYLDHTNWTETKDECLEYIISEDEKIIKEIVKTDDELTRIKLLRYEREREFNINEKHNGVIVFAKKQNKKNVFLGVYGDAECKILEDGLFIIMYKKISDICFRS